MLPDINRALGARCREKVTKHFFPIWCNHCIQDLCAVKCACVCSHCGTERIIKRWCDFGLPWVVSRALCSRAVHCTMHSTTRAPLVAR